ncbi:RNA polymerase sigma factor [Nocardiopsis coralliicola]
MPLGDQTCQSVQPEVLLLRARAGDADAFAALMQRYRAMVGSIVALYRLTHADADDAKQTVWCLLAEHLDRIREPAAIGRWIARTTHDAAVRQRRRASRTAPTDPSELHAVDHRDPETQTLAEERDRRVHAAIAALPEPDRTLLALDLYRPRTSAAEAAECTGLPKSEIEVARKRARRHLRSRLRRDPRAFGIPALDDRPEPRPAPSEPRWTL